MGAVEVTTMPAVQRCDTKLGPSYKFKLMAIDLRKLNSSEHLWKSIAINFDGNQSSEGDLATSLTWLNRHREHPWRTLRSEDVGHLKNWY